MNTAAQPTFADNLKRVFYRPPWVGLLAFAIVFMVQGLGHTLMTGMEWLFGDQHVLLYATILGIAGGLLLFVGMRMNGEVGATWLGFFAGTFLWTGWVEFAFVWAKGYLGVPDLMDTHAPGDIATKGEYLVMMSSVGVLFATLLPLMLNRETKCNLFVWCQRNLRMRTGKPSRGFERNFAFITCLETMYVVWFCYIALLFIYDESILGDRHPVTYAIFAANTIWAFYLLQRLAQMWRVTTAIRYAIPTGIIAYTSYEIVGRWNLFADIWVHPGQYWLELSLIFGALLVAVGIAALTPQHQKARLDQKDNQIRDA